MFAAKTLKRYIQQCDELLEKPSDNEAKELITEIVNVFHMDMDGLTDNLDSYSFHYAERNTDYVADMRLLRARLQKELDVIEPDIDFEDDVHGREKKVFISHATLDKDYVETIVDLLESLGFNEDEIICSSIPPYCVPLGNSVYDWLVNEFQRSDLHVIFALSKNYYTRPVCLNEMGAAWAMKHKWTAILLPGFAYEEVKGCIDPAQVGIKLDDADRDTLKHRLGELKDALTDEFGLKKMSSTRWEKKRDEFLDKVEELIRKKTQEQLQKEVTNQMRRSIKLQQDECVLLSYAADDPNGKIFIVNSITRLGPSIETHGFNFVKSDTPREYARWKSALEKLENYTLIQPKDYKRQIFEVTDQGFKTADEVKQKLGIDTAKSPFSFLDDYSCE